MTKSPNIPVVMCFSGLDSTGGAGIQADIEAIISMGCHASPVVTASTIQNTHNVKNYMATEASWLENQARTVLEDMPIAAFKIGMLAEPSIVKILHQILLGFPDIPVVLDPVLTAGGGGSLSQEKLVTAIQEDLLPLTTVITPNHAEALRFANETDNSNNAAMQLLNSGCEYVLVTGADEQTQHVENHLYADQQLLESFTWERLPQHYHGSGCTLAASIAALLAQGLDPFTAIHEAQEFTWEALKNAYQIGKGQWIPNRLFWARGEDNE